MHVLNCKDGPIAGGPSTAALSCYFVWAKRLHADMIHFVVHQVHGDVCFIKPTVHAWWKKMLGGQKFASGTNMPSIVFQWLGQLQPKLFFASGIQKLSDRWDRNWTMLENKTIMFNN